MRKNIKFLSVILSVILALGTIVCAGGCNNGNHEGKFPDAVGPVDAGEQTEVSGVHIFNVGKSETDLVKQGKSEYKIVSPVDPDDFENKGCSEFTYFFRESTGISLQTVSDAGLTWTDTAKYISIGETALLDGRGIDYSYELLGDCGYRIVTKGNTVFVIGATGTGTMYGAYELLHQLFGFEIYSEDCIVYDKNVTDKKLPVFDVTDVPDIQLNCASYGNILLKADTLTRMRLLRYENIFMKKEYNTEFHNTFTYLPPDEFMSDYPEWYSLDGKQLCYTARGDREKYDALVDEAASRMVEVVKQYPERRYLTFTQMDGSLNGCKCETCETESEAYGGCPISSQIKLCNRIHRKLKTLLELQGIDREVNLLFFAYNYTEQPPVKTASDGQLVAIDDEVICDEGVFPLYAPITMDYHYSFAKECNKTYAEQLAGWNVLADKIFVWMYDTNFHYYLVPFNTFNSFHENYKTLKKNGVSYLFNQGQTTNGNSTGFSNLKMYLHAKLGWNVNYDWNELLDNYFDNYFGPASASMRNYYEQLISHMTYAENNLGGAGSIYSEPLKTELWPKKTLDGFMKNIDDALTSIARLENTDGEEYEKLYNRIALERFSMIYLQIELYESKFSPVESYGLKKTAKSDAEKLGITAVKEWNAPISSLWAKWGI